PSYTLNTGPRRKCHPPRKKKFGPWPVKLRDAGREHTVLTDGRRGPACYPEGRGHAMITVIGIGLLLLLPQPSGLLVTRLARRSSWAAWPGAAIAVFGAAFYWWLWMPARAAAE